MKSKCDDCIHKKVGRSREATHCSRGKWEGDNDYDLSDKHNDIWDKCKVFRPDDHIEQ